MKQKMTSLRANDKKVIEVWKRMENANNRMIHKVMNYSDGLDQVMQGNAGMQTSSEKPKETL